MSDLQRGTRWPESHLVDVRYPAVAVCSCGWRETLDTSHGMSPQAFEEARRKAWELASGHREGYQAKRRRKAPGEVPTAFERPA